MSTYVCVYICTYVCLYTYGHTDLLIYLKVMHRYYDTISHNASSLSMCEDGRGAHSEVERGHQKSLRESFQNACHRLWWPHYPSYFWLL